VQEIHRSLPDDVRSGHLPRHARRMDEVSAWRHVAGGFLPPSLRPSRRTRLRPDARRRHHHRRESAHRGNSMFA
jgi:hypothetical protein